MAGAAYLPRLLTALVAMAGLEALTLATALPARAQDGGGFLAETLESNLSGPGREVRIRGVSGALSSQASIALITVSDDTGVWLQIENAVIDWNRAALFARRLDITTMTAQNIEILRPPVPPEGLPAPEASGFALPELPVSVNIGQIAADRVFLGQELFGHQAIVTVNGAVSLVGGRALADLTVLRIDQRRGTLRLTADIDGNGGEMALSLALSEPADGVIANALNIDGLPSLDLTLTGSGPPDAFAAELSLATDGIQRLRGSARIARTADPDPSAPGDLGFDLDVTGDIARLFAPDYREFFGPDLAVQARGAVLGAGGVVVDQVLIATAALEITGRLASDAAGTLTDLHVTGRMGHSDGSPVILPVGGPLVRVANADFALSQTEQANGSWRLALNLRGFDRDGLRIESARVNLAGTRPGGAPTLTAILRASADGLVHDDPAIAEALGSTLRLGAMIEWQDSVAGLRLSQAELVTRALRLQMSGEMGGLDSGLALSGQAHLQTEDLSVLADLAGLGLAGAADLRLSGQGSVLGGAFEMNISGSTRDLVSGIDVLDPVLGGDGSLDAEISRDETGVELRHLAIETAQLALRLSGRAQTGALSLTAEARLADSGLIWSDLSGPLSVSGTLDGPPDRLVIDLDARGPRNSALRSVGAVRQEDGQTVLALRLVGAVPLSLTDPLLATRAARARGDLSLDLRLQGSPELASLGGVARVSGGSFTDPAYRISLRELDAEANITAGVARLNATARSVLGGGLSAEGSIDLTGAGLPANLAVAISALNLADRQFYETSLNGSLGITGPILGGARIAGEISLGQTELRVPDSTALASGELPDLRHLRPPADVLRTLARAGLTGNGNGGGGPVYSLDISVLAERAVFVRGRGLDAEMGGRLRIGGTTDAIQTEGAFSLIRGRLDILGRRLSLVEGLISLSDRFEPDLMMLAETQGNGLTVQVVVSGSAYSPQVRLTSQPEMPQDEILAQLFFGKGLGQLSLLQVASLAGAVAELSGRSGGGLLDRIRRATGLADLDLRTDDNGDTSLAIGAYVTENLYTDLSVDQHGRTNVTINLDISPSVTARGRLGSEGDSSIGIWFERDY